ncbi:SGNH/GDSL hydrolase family protein [Sphingomonas nostoxanthinifaciens]|uniref:SGNH/GDSL hydrolase family protein n=1 Tax=Sphingomonas nostoxanthinifaciens TaxID=2872652 RepID=UPI001CC1D4E9|nr:SGNH/GDSL hydrolase family protein [Sphingomonas nostoxanthinifaciens]UAK26132.1 SGNH/GDSL hydrolase family protein [Sphingomonas nostoxanthinifaciens]
MHRSMGRMTLTLGAALIASGAMGAPCAGTWHGVWSAAPMAVAGDDPLKPADLADATLRQTVKLTGGATRMRIRLSNLMGTAPLRLDHIRLSVAPASGAAAVDPARMRAVSFGGGDAVVIPAGADYLSDPIALDAPAGTVLSISLHSPEAPAGITSHPGARTTTRLVPGNEADRPALTGGRTMEHWYFVAGVEGEGCGGAIVALGDSITDGHGATTDGDDRWTDRLAARLQATGGDAPAILNLGIGGNRVLLDGLGPNALARFDRDVVAQPGARAVIVLEGINDLGTLTRDHPVSPAEHAALVRRLTEAYAQIVARAHAHGIKAIGATITPDGGSTYYHPDAANEADRQAVNAWIRAPGHFDSVVDFDAALRDPADASRLRSDYDSGDHLHPNPQGYRRMGEVVPLALLR